MSTSSPRRLFQASRRSGADRKHVLSAYYVVAVLTAAVAPTTLAQEAPPSLRETLDWLATMPLGDPPNRWVREAESARWQFATTDGCNVSVRETVYSGSVARLSTTWTVDFGDIDTNRLQDQLEPPIADAAIHLRLTRRGNRYFYGAPNDSVGAIDVLKPNVVSTSELVLPTANREQRIAIGNAVLHAARLCASQAD